MASLAYCVLLLVTVLSFSPDSCFCAAHQSKPEHKAALFVFGDSLFDSGNNKYLNNSSPAANAPANNLPYGETYFKHATGRYSDGRIVPDFIAQFAKLPFPPPYLQPGAPHFTDGVNFASGGAGVLPGGNFGAIDFPTQLSYFKAMEKSLGQRLGDKETKKLLGRAVYLFSIGGNDYFSYATNNPNAPQIYKRQYVAMVIGNLTSVLKEIYNLGGRKIAFQNVGPLGCTPGTKAMNPALGGNCSEAHLTLARLHNRALFIAFKKFEKSLPGFKFSIFDYYNAAGDRISNPSKYGFKNGTSACCGSGPFRGSKCGTEPYELCSNPSEYVWFDGAHTTESANHQLAELIWNGPQNITGPYTIDFPTQLSYFKAMEKSLGQRLGDKETKKLLGRAVYLFSIGGNDYFSYATNNPNAPQIYKRQYVAMVIGNLTSVLKEIYNLGGRKIAFQNVGPLGCTPGTKAMNPALGGNCSEAHLTLARLHNRALFIAFKKFEKSLPGFKFSIFDYYNAAGDRISNPSKYGFKNGTSACCGSGPFRGSKCGTEPYELCSNPSEYVWFDGAHTTESANHQLAELIWNGPQNITGPYTVKELFELA